jgi:NitT/TauT family transport system substrate-binding protein
MTDASKPLHLTRRVLLAGVAGLSLSAACRKRSTDATTLRLGSFPNLTHAPALTGTTSGRFAQALGATRLVSHSFNAGPAAIEALMAGALDATFVGPTPAAAGFVRSRGTALKVVAGAASGGTSFVVRRGANIRGPSDLHGKRLASPQIGNTQDIALRHYLSEHGLTPAERGGDVQLTAVENANILSLFRQGGLDGAWVPEPWASRLVLEADGVVLLDERDLWPGRAFAITLLVVRQAYLRDAPDAVDRLVEAAAREVRWIREHDAEARSAVSQALGAQTGRPLPAPLLNAAWPHLDFTADALRSTVETSAQRAHALGMFPSRDVTGLFDEIRCARAVAVAGGAA